MTSSDGSAAAPDLWGRVIGQPTAVHALQAGARAPLHAYLLVGPRGAGTLEAATAFAAEVLSADLTADAAARVQQLAGANQHPDLVVIEPDGTIFRGTADRDKGVSPGQRLLQEAAMSPTEGDRKVIVAVDFHLANDQAIGRLLKVIEEPPPSTIIVLLEDEVPPEQATIASRCVRVDFGPVPDHLVVEHLIERGADRELAQVVARQAAGDVRRAVQLADDEEVRARLESWRSVGRRLDGTGARVYQLAAELRGHLDAAQAAAEVTHAAELERLAEEDERYGEKRRSHRDVAERQKRELRQIRTRELEFGLATLAGPYRERLATAPRPAPLVDSLRAVQKASEALERNPIESLLLEALLLQLEPLSA